MKELRASGIVVVCTASGSISFLEEDCSSLLASSLGRLKYPYAMVGSKSARLGCDSVSPIVDAKPF